MIGLDQEDEIEEITLRPEIGGMKQFAMMQITVWNGHTQIIFAFSDLVRPMVLSLSECLVKSLLSNILVNF